MMNSDSKLEHLAQTPVSPLRHYAISPWWAAKGKYEVSPWVISCIKPETFHDEILK